MNKFFEELKKDHKEVKGIIMQLTEMKSGSSAKREELFMKLKQELLPHQKAEEMVFYHPLQDKKQTRELAFEGEEEHHIAEVFLDEFEVEDEDKDHWLAKMKVLKELVDHHIEQEEGEIFQGAEKVMKPNEFDSIMSQFKQEDRKSVV